MLSLIVLPETSFAVPTSLPAICTPLRFSVTVTPLIWLFEPPSTRIPFE